MNVAQTATEYLVMIATMLVFLAIIAFPLLDIGEVQNSYQDQASRHYWQRTDVGIIAAAFNTTHGSLVLQNNLLDPINITAIKIEDGVLIIPINLTAGSRNLSVFSFPMSGYSASDPYSFTVAINYTNLRSGSHNSFSGQVPLIGRVAAGNVG